MKRNKNGIACGGLLGGVGFDMAQENAQDIKGGETCFDLQESKFLKRIENNEFGRPAFLEHLTGLKRIRPLRWQRRLSKGEKFVSVLKG